MTKTTRKKTYPNKWDAEADRVIAQWYRKTLLTKSPAGGNFKALRQMISAALVAAHAEGIAAAKRERK